jgi:hypothetical protein
MSDTDDRDARCMREWPGVYLEARRAGKDPWQALIDRGLIDAFGPYALAPAMGPSVASVAAAPESPWRGRFSRE